MKINDFSKKVLKFSTFTIILAAAFVTFYIKGLPAIVSNQKIIQNIQNSIQKQTNANVIISNPVLNTHFSSNVELSIDEISIVKNNIKILELKNFSSAISLKKLLLKSITIKKLVAENVFADINALENMFSQNKTKKENKKSNNWNIDVYDALLGLKECGIIYSFNPETKINFKGEHIGVNNAEKGKRNVYFQLYTDILKNNKHVTLQLNDNGKVYFENNLFHIDDCPLSINKSNIFINLTADRKQKFDINLVSKNFNINDIIELLNTQIIENNVNESLVYFSDISGNTDFKLNIKQEGINGQLKLNRADFKVKDVDNIPITLTKGEISITPQEVQLKGFEGFYDENPVNKLDFEGTVKDYLKTIDTDIEGKAIVRNDIFKTHLSNITGTPLELNGEAPTRIKLKSKNNIMDLNWLFMLKPKQNIKVANDFLPFEDSLRFMNADMHLENMILDIKSLDYHMVPADKILTREEYAQKRAEGEKFEPVFRLKSSLNLANNNEIRFVGFEIPKPLPSELLNAVLHQEIFKKGQISGNLTVDNTGKFPVLNGSMSMDKVLIPIQRMFVKQAILNANNNIIHINALGGYRRAKFSFNGDILNELKFPLIIKNVDLSLENLDVLQALEGFNSQYKTEDVIATDEGIVTAEAKETDFDIRNIIIEQCRFHLDKGSYKQIEFADLDADLTLDRNGIAIIQSNKFNFAEGESSLRADFDLVNKKYSFKLGVLNVNSDKIADALLDLKREITGSATGFLDLYTDDSMKLNGSIDFKIIDGSIEKIGLVEYVLKCASLLRNTVTMINPGTFADIVNIPNGNFDKITGELKLRNNVVTGLKIRTFSPELSTYISGRYNIDNGDTSLRIYTKFSDVKKGFTGFLRKISLNSLANRLPLSSKNDANYYAIELKELPDIAADEKDCQIYLTRIEGDVVNNNYISSLKKIK